MATDPNAQADSGGAKTYPNGAPDAASTSGVGHAEAQPRSLLRTAYENPLPIIVAGVGLALALTARSRPRSIYDHSLNTVANELSRTARRAAKLARKEFRTRRHQLADAASAYMSDAVSEARRHARRKLADAREAAADYANDSMKAARRRARRQLADTGSALSDLASEAFGAARRRARQIRSDGLTDFVTHKPVALSALGILLGALTAAAIPLARSRGWLEREEDSGAPQ